MICPENDDASLWTSFVSARFHIWLYASPISGEDK